MKPMLLRRVAFGDGDEAREARLRSEQVVVRVVGLSGRDVVADAEDLALLVEEETEVHPSEKLVAPPRQTAQAREHGRYGRRRVFDCRGERGHAAENRLLARGDVRRLLRRVGRLSAQVCERGVVDFRRTREAFHTLNRERAFGSQRGGEGGREYVTEVRVTRVDYGCEGAQVARELFQLSQQRARPEDRLSEITRPVLL